MFRSILQSKWLTLAGVFLISFLGLAVYKILPAVIAVNKETESLRKKIEETGKSAAEIEKSKEYLQNPDYLERQARIRLNYKKPDEKVVFVYKSPYNQNPEMKPNNPQGLFGILKDWFINLMN